MKAIIILGDGMADYPIQFLKGKTPLMAAHTPAMDALCRRGRSGKLVTIPRDMPPGSEVANLAVLGYNVYDVYQGRGVLEAAAMGVALDSSDLALRCNLICIENGKIKNHSAGHITTEEARPLIERLNMELGSDRLRFYPGVSYRHVLVVKQGSSAIQCTPPHDVPGTPFKNVLVKAKDKKGLDTAVLLNNLIMDSQSILKAHPINRKRSSQGEDPANSIWIWAQGYKPQMKTLKEKYGVTGAVISAVDLIFGIGVYAGMKSIHVEGATGLYNTNYRGKAKAALDAIREVDLVYLHVEAPDEAGHEGNIQLKIKTLEDLDKQIVKPIMDGTARMGLKISLALLCDHPTPCEIRTHVHDPVPFVIAHPDEDPDTVKEYNEKSVEKGFYGTLKGDQFIKAVLKIQ